MKGIAVYTGVLGVAVALFLFIPQIDLATSRLFYVSGYGFVSGDWLPVQFLYRAVPWISRGICAVVATGALWLVLIGRPLWRLDRKALIFLAVATVVGPGLLANAVLKDHWGRARPTQIEAFGGTGRFTPAPLPAAECARNCSFVSGHAALGFSLVAFAFLLPVGRSRRAATAVTLGVGAAIGLGRIAQGGHFLSDIVFAGLLVYGTTALLFWWIVDNDGLATTAFRTLYRELDNGAAAVWASGRRAFEGTAARLGLATAATIILIVISIGFVDRPIALFFHARDPDLRALFDFTGRLGLTYGYLTTFGLAFVALHWGGSLPRLRPYAGPMRAFSAVPAFLFLSIAASGIVVDILKFLFGRPRPKLLFGGGVYEFCWPGLRPDHWSFPSGHSATIVALTTALWLLWPRHVLFYVLVATIVAFSRVVIGAHYPSDVLAGALVAVLTSTGVAVLFSKNGIDLAKARQANLVVGDSPPWPCRRFRRVPISGRQAPESCVEEIDGRPSWYQRCGRYRTAARITPVSTTMTLPNRNVTRCSSSDSRSSNSAFNPASTARRSALSALSTACRSALRALSTACRSTLRALSTRCRSALLAALSRIASNSSVAMCSAASRGCRLPRGRGQG